MIASDGIAFGDVVKKNMMVTGGGERHDLLLCFEEPGEYLIKSDHLSTIQFFGTGPRDQILAKIVVTEEDSGQPMSSIEKMRFTPGIPAEGPPGTADIQPSEITHRRHFVFDMDGDTCRLPYPQFRINDTVYQTDTVDFEIEQGTVEEWVGQPERRHPSLPRPRQRLSGERELFRAGPGSQAGRRRRSDRAVAHRRA